MKLRQPLRALVVEGAPLAESHAGEVADELRVREVSFGQVEASELRVKPNLPLLGPKLGKVLDKFLGSETQAARVVDLLFQLPTGAVDRRPSPSIADTPIGDVATFTARVSEHRAAPVGKKAPYRIIVEDETGDVTLVFFHADSRHLAQTLPIGAYRLIRHIGSGGMADVWFAERVDGAFSRQVAIKLLFRHAAGSEVDSISQRFARERDSRGRVGRHHFLGSFDVGGDRLHVVVVLEDLHQAH